MTYHALSARALGALRIWNMEWWLKETWHSICDMRQVRTQKWQARAIEMVGADS